MKKIIFILLLFVSNFASSQNFAPLNAKWHFQKYCNNPPWMNNCGYFTAEIVRDTTVLSSAAKIMENRNLGNYVSNGNIILKEDSNRIYFYENNQFKLLYDFNLIQGDTLIFSIPFNFKPYDFTCGGLPDTSEFSKALIDSTKILNINGQMLKALYTSPIYNLDTSLYYSWSMGQIIERIGSLNGLFGYSTTQCLGGFFGYLRCYDDSLTHFKPVPEDCDFVTGIKSMESKYEINISPNPSSTYFTIEGLEELYHLTIYNALGQTVYKEDKVNEASKKIDISTYKSGLLFIKIEVEHEVYYQKVIKQ